MKNKFIKITTATIILVAGWIIYEFYINKTIIQNAENIEVLDPTINTDILNGIKTKYYF